MPNTEEKSIITGYFAWIKEVNDKKLVVYNQKEIKYGVVKMGDIWQVERYIKITDPEQKNNLSFSITRS